MYQRYEKLDLPSQREKTKNMSWVEKLEYYRLQFYAQGNLEDIDHTKCWIWKGPMYPTQTGKFKYEDQFVRAPRWWYEFSTEVILGQGQKLYHTCNDHRCVNVFHMTTENPKVDKALWDWIKWEQDKNLHSREADPYHSDEDDEDDDDFLSQPAH